jgi:hypothetical protein
MGSKYVSPWHHLPPTSVHSLERSLDPTQWKQPLKKRGAENCTRVAIRLKVQTFVYVLHMLRTISRMIDVRVRPPQPIPSIAQMTTSMCILG